jgi:acetyl-CoA C-acetyltransferase
VNATNTSVIVAGARTPVGRLMGSLSDFSGSDLGGIAIKAALAKAGVSGDQVQYVIMGQVRTAGAGQIPARQAAIAAGIPMSVPALTIKKVCLSGIDAIALADQLIRVGNFDVVVAGGQESTTQTRSPAKIRTSSQPARTNARQRRGRTDSSTTRSSRCPCPNAPVIP